jgi:predicted SAM-dependent methyltransferase
MTKLNFGCGTRIASGWTNIDFHCHDSRVQRVNLLRGFPFPTNHFDSVYSSHVLEHFTRDQAAFLMGEAHRVLKPSGIVRIVVPDLEDTAREYLRILDLPDDDPEKPRLYSWTKIELLDQLVRSTPGGDMGKFISSTISGGDRQMLAYIRSRIESAGWTPSQENGHRSSAQRLAGVTPGKLSEKITLLYLASVKKLIPRHIRSMIVSDTSIGERHRWMYDRYGMRLLMQEAGFLDISFRAFNKSRIAGFTEDHLDSNADGSSYKNASIYCEAQKTP